MIVERRKWKAEEKLVIIKEIEETEYVSETCRKYWISNSMYNKRKEAFNTFGRDRIKPYAIRPDL